MTITDSTSAGIVIIGLTRNCRAQDGKRRTIAFFDVAICDLIELRGCCLVRTRDGLTVLPPRLDSDDARRGVSLADSLIHALRVAATNAYKALGGDDLPDWALRKSSPARLPESNGVENTPLNLEEMPR